MEFVYFHGRFHCVKVHRDKKFFCFSFVNVFFFVKTGSQKIYYYKNKDDDDDDDDGRYNKLSTGTPTLHSVYVLEKKIYIYMYISKSAVRLLRTYSKRQSFLFSKKE